MPSFADPGSWLSRLVFVRGLSLVYLLAFLAAASHFRALLGEDGLLPIPRYARLVGFKRAPSLFTLRYSDRLFAACCWIGAALSVAGLAGGLERLPLWAWMVAWAVLWALYLSIVNVGQTWYSFGWESLLVEVGFLAVFLGPASVAPPRPGLWLLRWVLFRLEFGAGLIKMRGDPCWRDLTCLHFHHETQPMPNPLSWWFHHLPGPLHKVEVLSNHAVQLVVVWGLFLPQPYASVAAALIVVTQAYLLISGNFAWLNALTLTIGLSVVSGSLLHRVLPVDPPHHLGQPVWFQVVVLVVFAGVLALSWAPVRNMASPNQRMNASFNRLHLVNAYGAFGSVTRERHEVVIEGTSDPHPSETTEWREYEFRGKPGDPQRRPPQVAPYHLRLDWLMWFAGISPSYARDWFEPLTAKLLEGDPHLLRLLRTNPFPDEPPAWIRARLFHYRFTTFRERRATKAVWVREPIGVFQRPRSRRRRVPEGPE